MMKSKVKQYALDALFAVAAGLVVSIAYYFFPKRPRSFLTSLSKN